MGISERILAERKKMGLSQEALAEVLYVSRQTVSKWESGKTEPSLDNVIRMSQLFGVSTEFLINGTQQDKNGQADIIQEAQHGNALPAKKDNQKNAWLIVVLSVLLTVAILILIISYITSKSETRENITSDEFERADISELAKSVLYLEILDKDDTVVGSASGFLVNEGAELITNYHVLENAYTIRAWTADGNDSMLINDYYTYDVTNDIAVLKCNSRIGVRSVVLNDSDNAMLGDNIYAISYPLGVTNTVSNGIISAKYIDDSGRDIIQVTAPISQGSSGGALFDEEGGVIGIICAYYEDGQNLNLTISSNSISEILAHNSLSEAKSISGLYTMLHAYGNNSFNISGQADAYVAESAECIFYCSGYDYDIYRCEKSNTGKRTIIGNGSKLNVYKNRLYYYDPNEQDICSCDLYGNSKHYFHILDAIKTYSGDSADSTVTQLLVAEDKIILTCSSEDYTCETGTVYFIDLVSSNVIDSVSNTLILGTYIGDVYYVGMADSSIMGISLKNLERFIFQTSCRPYVLGSNGRDTIYYVDSNDEFASGIYYIDIFNGVEQLNNSFTGENAGWGNAYALSVYKTELILSTVVNDKTENYILEPDGVLTAWGVQDQFVFRLNCLDSLPYLFMDDGTTIEANSGKVLGTWVFD